MKKFMLTMAALMAVPVLMAGEWYGGKVTVAAGDTNGVVDVNLYKELGDGSAGAIDTIEYYCVSGSATGSVTFANYDLGAAVSIASASSLTSGTVGATRPMYSYVQTGTTTNQIPYMAKTVRITVSQGVVADDMVYKFGIITK